ncbi:MAG: family transcriptional regulator [Mucilaginibacter sp.]|nr:family transcriptional regulator [Mucilaginibacter sp.]
MLQNLNNFQPNWASPPGETINDILSEQNISITSFASKMESTTDFINDLLKGYITLNQGISYKLEKILGPPSDFWLTRESQYREAVARLKAAEDNWLKELPLKDMIGFGWLETGLKNTLEACLDYFNIPSVSAWYKKYEVELAMASFRTSKSYNAKTGAVAAWLRRGELKSESIVCQPWNPKLFKETLKTIKELTREKDPTEFIPKLTSLCASCGVAVAVVRTPTGCQASGVTKFLNSERALLMLSFRYLTDDHFWFTFFHEAGHLLLHGNKAIFLEEIGGGGANNRDEDEANDFAAEQLIPFELKSQLMRIAVSNKRSVIGFASLAGVSPGIVIGQLQHAGRIEHNRFNSYKRRYSWEDINLI